MQTKPCFSYYNTHVLIATRVGEGKHTGAAFLQSLRNFHALSEMTLPGYVTMVPFCHSVTHRGPLANGYSGGMVASVAFKFKSPKTFLVDQGLRIHLPMQGT